MILNEIVKFGDKTFVHSHSNDETKQIQDQNGNVYDDAFDVPNTSNVYVEIDKQKIEEPKEDEKLASGSDSEAKDVKDDSVKSESADNQEKKEGE